MKTLTNIVVLAFLLSLGLGCQSTPTRVGQLLATTAVTVDDGMKGWASYVVLHNPPQQQQDSVRTAYNEYQVSMFAARRAYDTYLLTKDEGALNSALQILTQNRATLLNLISLLTIIKEAK